MMSLSKTALIRFGEQLLGPFNTGAGIELSAVHPTLWTPLRRLLLPITVFLSVLVLSCEYITKKRCVKLADTSAHY